MLKSFLLGLVMVAMAAPVVTAQDFTRADTLRGSVTPERAWWDVAFYDLHVRPEVTDSTVSGMNTIVYRVVKPGVVMQIDLQEPMDIQKVEQNGRELAFSREGDAFFVSLEEAQMPGTTNQLTITFGGRPIVARRPPWDGGLVWARDSLDRPWIATACQGDGASMWWPLKDHQSDEPDSMKVTITVPRGMVGVSNGRLRNRTQNYDTSESFEWFVSNPINTYGVTMNVAHYEHFGGEYAGEEGGLDLDYWVLDYNLDRAKNHFGVVGPMMEAFEHWFGPYPFYEDGFKLIETPFLGMEHQSGVAYGNRYLFGYAGRDLSDTGWGMKWDFMIIHESGHEWFGNNVTTEDIADMWVHEGFTNYSETLFTEYTYGKEGGDAYLQGSRRNIRNDIPVIGPYGVNRSGSGDMYYKGASMLHTIRQVIGDDELFRSILRGLNRDYRHSIVTSAEVEQYISEKSGMDFSKVFDQYLRTVNIPVFDYRVEDGKLMYRWQNVVEGFDMPLDVQLGTGGKQRLYPTLDWQNVPTAVKAEDVKVDPNFFVVAGEQASPGKDE